MDNFEQENQKSHLPKIIIFKAIGKHFAMIGIIPKLVTQSYPINVKMFTVFLMPTLGVIFVGVYVVKYAESFVEYTQAIFMASAGCLVSFLLLAMILKVKKLYEFISCLEKMTNTSN